MSSSRRDYARQVIDAYLWLPGTPHKASRRDRALAKTLYDSGVPLRDIQAALLLAGARRALRSPKAETLPPVRTLHYFLPALEEVRHMPPEPDYLEHLRAKLWPLAEAKASTRFDERSEIRAFT